MLPYRQPPKREKIQNKIPGKIKKPAWSFLSSARLPAGPGPAGRSECGAIYIGFFYTCRILEIHIIL